MEELVFGGADTLLLPVMNVRRGASSPMVLFGAYPSSTDLWQRTATGTRRVGAINGFSTCGTPEDARAICFSRGRSASTIWLVDGNGATTPLAELRTSDVSRVQFGPGLQATFPHAGNFATRVDAASKRITDIRLPDATGYLGEARTSSDHVVVLRYEGSVTHVVRYRLK